LDYSGCRHSAEQKHPVNVFVRGKTSDRHLTSFGLRPYSTENPLSCTDNKLLFTPTHLRSDLKSDL
jgi:hypothetical protein